MAKVIRFVGVVASFLSEFLPLLLSTSLLLFVAWLCVFRFFGFCFVFSVYGQLSSPAISLEPSSHAQFSTHTTQRKSTELNNGHLSKVRHFCCRRCVCIVARRVYAAYESYYAYATLLSSTVCSLLANVYLCHAKAKRYPLTHISMRAVSWRRRQGVSVSVHDSHSNFI